ncbi:hypothetical protein BJX66DRAFT_341405 [Aspergillus keveii]|uniref:Uncharacterized protein n=1 Tax=Aspergillus keveii TaxID=714993 RepID=A0ABR4FW56_9EURO
MSVSTANTAGEFAFGPHLGLELEPEGDATLFVTVPENIAAHYRRVSPQPAQTLEVAIANSSARTYRLSVRVSSARLSNTSGTFRAIRRQLAYDALAETGYSSESAETIASRLLDTQLPSYSSPGLPHFAFFDGNGRLEYLVGKKATKLVISKAKEMGIANVTAFNTWTTGMLVCEAEKPREETSLQLSQQIPHRGLRSKADTRVSTARILFVLGFLEQDAWYRRYCDVEDPSCT